MAEEAEQPLEWPAAAGSAELQARVSASCHRSRLLLTGVCLPKGCELNCSSMRCFVVLLHVCAVI